MLIYQGECPPSKDLCLRSSLTSVIVEIWLTSC